MFAGTDLVSGNITGSVVEAGGSVTTPTAGTPTATGTLTDTDVDNPANTFAAVAPSGTASTYGTYAMTDWRRVDLHAEQRQ